MKTNQLMQIAEKSGLPQTKAQALLKIFQQFFEVVAEWEVKAFEIVVTDESQTDIMEQASEGRKVMQRARKDCEDKRVLQKRHALLEGRAVDGMANIIKFAIKPIEDHLYKQEHFVKIRDDAIKKEREEKAMKLLQDQERKEQLKKDRLAEQERRDNIKMKKKLEVQNAKLKKQETVIKKQTTEISGLESIATDSMQETEDLRKNVISPLLKSKTVQCPACGEVFTPGGKS